ncbi:MAG: M23 family metallopeptidase [Solirubrobacterales bacterium]
MALVLLCFVPGQSDARPDSKAELSPVAFNLLDKPTPVRGADGKMHLAYELEVNNLAPFDVTITKVGARANKNSLGKTLTGSALAERTRLNNGDSGTTLSGGTGGLIFMDVIYGMGRKVPQRISHAIGLSWTDPATLTQRTATMYGVNSKVRQQPAIKVASPLRGGKWVAASGCCTLNPHRGATLSIDGNLRAPERFAIDFIQMNDDNRLFSGAIDDLKSYEYFGTKIHAARSGRVVKVRDGLPEQVPGTAPVNPTIQSAGGNHVVVKMAPGRFAFYAHMKTGSVRVKRGQKVKAGKVLGLLGNTGNSDSPHLHFHVMNGPSPLQSNGVPYTFRKFRGQGFVDDIDKLVAGEDPGITRRLIGPHRNQLTLDNQIVNFGG